VALATALYELHVLRGDRWVIDAVLHERDDALDMARGVAARSDADGVRVVKECYSRRTDTSSARTIHEAIRPPRPVVRRRPPPPPPASPPAEASPAPPPERPLRPGPPRLSEPPSWWGSAAGLSSLAAGALALVVAMLSLLA
jgi:hypothetical protein